MGIIIQQELTSTCKKRTRIFYNVCRMSEAILLSRIYIAQIYKRGKNVSISKKDLRSVTKRIVFFNLCRDLRDCHLQFSLTSRI